MGPGMLYIVGKIFLYGLRFDIVYNETPHENMKNLENLFFSQCSENLFKTEMEVHETALCHHTHISLSNRSLQIQIIS